MSRQNFISREAFLETSEVQAKESLMSVPVFAPHIQLIREDKKLHSFKFSYLQPVSNIKYLIDISILPANDLFTRVNFRSWNADGQSIKDDSLMQTAISDFISAVSASIMGDTRRYEPKIPKEKRKAFLNFSFLLPQGNTGLLLGKKLS